MWVSLHGIIWKELITWNSEFVKCLVQLKKPNYRMFQMSSDISWIVRVTNQSHNEHLWRWKLKVLLSISTKLALIDCSLVKTLFLNYISNMLSCFICRLSVLSHWLWIFPFVLAGISRFSGGCIYQFPLFKASDTVLSDSFDRSFRRYLTRKIGFEAVMRIRCSRYGKKRNLIWWCTVKAHSLC